MARAGWEAKFRPGVFVSFVHIFATARWLPLKQIFRRVFSFLAYLSMQRSRPAIFLIQNHNQPSTLARMAGLDLNGPLEEEAYTPDFDLNLPLDEFGGIDFDFVQNMTAPSSSAHANQMEDNSRHASSELNQPDDNGNTPSVTLDLNQPIMVDDNYNGEPASPASCRPRRPPANPTPPPWSPAGAPATPA
ncbi:uncharacterized protein LOC120645549 [Panicum virgatum]|uniref:uncharacterized protein LOC120645549 n=1 Tax=Panicum virgatum TaxID=38727 RepID=UPI0019D61396|nr:uncharacterized protein LOC120645549 [Panicum virgatum]